MLPWQVAEILNNFASHFNCVCCVSIILNSDVVICVVLLFYLGHFLVMFLTRMCEI